MVSGLWFRDSGYRFQGSEFGNLLSLIVGGMCRPDHTAG